MNYLLDTNIVSELIAKRPEAKVIAFLDALEQDKLFLSVVTLGEIKFGIEKVKEIEKKEQLTAWLYHHLMVRFQYKFVDIDADVMLKWAQLQHQLHAQGAPMPLMDALIAATCLAKNFVLLTRNEKDFKNTGLEVINPFRV